MSRSPLAYPLNRGIDGDAGGAADLQTDIMRFMAILALCLVAIFALVQSIPLAPETAPQPPESVASEPPAPPAPPIEIEPQASPAPPEPERIALTRPKWQPQSRTEQPAPAPPAEAIEPMHTAEPQATPPPVAPAEEGFTLRFESDHALARLVAASQVGFYAIAPDRSQRMTVADSRISFWDASTPNSFHEMEAATVPSQVVDALARTGVDSDSVNWGVTLPGRLSRQLDSLMREHSGGSLVIAADGQLRLESK